MHDKDCDDEAVFVEVSVKQDKYNDDTIRDGGSTALSSVCTALCKKATMPIYI